MSKKSEDNIERFFRKAAGQYDSSTEFREDDWRKMEKMLDDEAERAAAAKFRRRRVGGFGAGIVILLSALYFFRDDFQSPAEIGALNNREESVSTHSERELNAEEFSPAGNADQAREVSPENIAPAQDNKSENSPAKTDRKLTGEGNGSSVPRPKADAASQQALPDGPALEKRSENRRVSKSDINDAVNLDNNTAGSQNDKNSERITSKDALNFSDTDRTSAMNVNDESSANSTSDVNDQKMRDVSDQENHVVDREIQAMQVPQNSGTITGKPDKSLDKEKMKDSNAEPRAIDKKDESMGVSGKQAGPGSLAGENREVAGIANDDGHKGKKHQPGDNTEKIQKNAVTVSGSSRNKSESDSVYKYNGREVTQNLNPHQSQSLNNSEEKQGGDERVSDRFSAIEPYRQSSSITLDEDSVNSKQDGKKKPEDKDQESRQHSDTTILHDKNWPTSKWSVALVAAPDFSSTGLSDYTTPGTAIGAIVQYQLLKRLSVSSGIIKSNKVYWGTGKEYNPPQGYWARKTNGVVPGRIDGTCMVLEIPLSIRYNLMEVEKNLLYVSVGVSSYLMREQEYNYTFETENPGAEIHWHAPKPMNYFFSIGDISIGYERQIKPRFSLGIEPYLKVPFSGVGWPGVNLYTTGAYVTVRYRFLKNGIGNANINP